MNFATKTLRHKIINIICVAGSFFLSWNHSRNAKFVLSISLCLSVLVAISQSPSKKINEFSTPEIDNVSIDRLCNFYLVLKKGVIKKYDTTGHFMDEFPNPEAYPI